MTWVTGGNSGALAWCMGPSAAIPTWEFLHLPNNFQRFFPPSRNSSVYTDIEGFPGSGMQKNWPRPALLLAGNAGRLYRIP